FNRCDAAYLKRIRAYFAEMQVQYKNTQQADLLRSEDTQTMAAFLFIDYFVMLAKTGFQEIINGFKQTTLDTKKGDSLESVALRYRHYGVTAQSLAFANRHRPLKRLAT